MKLVVLGATGQTGQPLVKQALAKGFNVTAVVREPKKLDPVSNALSQEEKNRLEIVKADIFDSGSLERVFGGADAVISTLGFSIFDRKQTGYSRVTQSVVEAMDKANCKRLVLMHAWNTNPNSRSECSFIERHVFIPLLAPILDDMNRAEQYLRSIKDGDIGSQIDWTCVLPPELTKGPVTTKDFHVVAGSCSVSGDVSKKISRADVARFLLRVVEDGSHKKTVVAICT